MKRISIVVKSFVTWRQIVTYSLAWLIVFLLVPIESNNITKYMGGVTLKENAAGIPFVDIFTWLFLIIIPVLCTNVRFHKAIDMYVMELPRYPSFNSWWTCYSIGVEVSCIIYVMIGICEWMFIYGNQGIFPYKEIVRIMLALPQYLYFLSLIAIIIFFLARTTKSVLLTEIFIGCNIIWGLNLQSPFIWLFGSMGMVSQFAEKHTWEFYTNIFILICIITIVERLGKRISQVYLEKIIII